MPDTSDKSQYRTSHTLLDRVRDQNDEEAWKEFIAYYEQYIYNILRYIRIPEADAKELCQDIIVKLWKKMPDFVYDKDRGKFRQWLGVVIKNDANTYFLRSKRNQQRFKSEEEHKLDSHEDQNSNFDLEKIIADEWEHYISDLAWQSVQSRFREKVQKIFLLFVEGKSNEEIATECDTTPSNVRSYVHRIRQHLKEQIEKYNDELL